MARPVLPFDPDEYIDEEDFLLQHPLVDLARKNRPHRIKIDIYDPFERMILTILDEPEVMRLNEILQPAFAQFGINSANHTRLNHCAGP